MILITGATGTIGSLVLSALRQHGAEVRTMTRDPERLAATSALSAEQIVRGDLDQPESLPAALAGVDTVFLLTAFGPRLPEQEQNLVAAATTAGVQRIVKLSAISTGEDPTGTRPADWHLPGEQAVRGSGLAWTVLRPAGFASNALQWAESVRAGLPVPNTSGTGAQGVVDPRDVAEVATAALLSPEHDGTVYTLTGPETLSVPDQTAVLAAELDRPVPVVEVDLATVRQQMLAAGMDESIVKVTEYGLDQFRRGDADFVTDDVQRVLGRPALSFAAWVREHRAAFENGD
ncbi:NAD(P)H-binding protein [Actinoalloteichus fjordicus]|nr:NAD(P)H-binding protein [Actinoalloteichus fjordicus]